MIPEEIPFARRSPGAMPDVHDLNDVTDHLIVDLVEVRVIAKEHLAHRVGFS